MKRLEELGISPAPWKLCRDGEIVHGNGYSLTDGDGYFVLKSDALLIAAAPKLYAKTWELLAAFDERVMTPGHVEALRAALAEAAGERVVK